MHPSSRYSWRPLMCCTIMRAQAIPPPIHTGLRRMSLSVRVRPFAPACPSRSWTSTAARQVMRWGLAKTRFCYCSSGKPQAEAHPICARTRATVRHFGSAHPS